MINLPSQLVPSELLCCEELPQYVDDLLRSCRSRCREGELLEAERHAKDIADAARGPDKELAQAVALIHRADVRREMGKLGPALAHCEQAQCIFQRQRSRCQRHNLAVTTYALGLTHQLLGAEMDALEHYGKADQLFERVKEDWAAVNDVAHTAVCARIRRWMKALSEYLTGLSTRPDTNLAACVCIPIALSDADGGGFAVAELRIDEYTMGNELKVDDQLFRAEILRGGRFVSLGHGAKCDALEIPDVARGPLNASDEDYALVIWGERANEEGPGVLETQEGLEFGDFTRGEGGTINFVTCGARVIGGTNLGDEQRVGYIAALLKPA